MYIYVCTYFKYTLSLFRKLNTIFFLLQSYYIVLSVHKLSKSAEYFKEILRWKQGDILISAKTYFMAMAMGIMLPFQNSW